MSNVKQHRKRGGGKGAQKKIEYKEEQQILVQPKQSYAAYEEHTDIDDDTKDFETLIKTPTSANAQLTFKSEKNWSTDVSGCFEYFTLDLNLISAAMKCIPFNECVQVDDEYFTADQLTTFHNSAEEGKEAYKDILSKLKVSSLADTIDSKEKQLETNLNSNKVKGDSNIAKTKLPSTNDESDSAEEDLDLLLSLESPTLHSNKKQVTITNVLSNNDFKTGASTLPTKPMDLESWLDSILDD